MTSANRTTTIAFTIEGYHQHSQHYQVLIDLHLTSQKPCHLPCLGDTITRLIACAQDVSGKLVRTSQGFTLEYESGGAPADAFRHRLARIPHVRLPVSRTSEASPR